MVPEAANIPNVFLSTKRTLSSINLRYLWFYSLFNLWNIPFSFYLAMFPSLFGCDGIPSQFIARSNKLREHVHCMLLLEAVSLEMIQSTEVLCNCSDPPPPDHSPLMAPSSPRLPGDGILAQGTHTQPNNNFTSLHENYQPASTLLSSSHNNTWLIQLREQKTHINILTRTWLRKSLLAKIK